MPGIHLHPHDIIDEGTEQILQFIGLMGNMKYIFPQVNTIFERNPYPEGRLPHNSVHEFVQGQGTLHVQLDPQAIYSPLYQKVDESMKIGQDPMRQLKNATDGTDLKIIPWVNLLNGHFEGDLLNNGVYDFRGRVVQHWLCPNGPDVVQMWTKLLIAITEQYGYSTFLIDRIRFPDWAGKEVRPQGLFSCFCSHCMARMKQNGLDVPGLRKEMETVSSLLRSHSFAQVAELFRRSEYIQQWIVFRQNSVSTFVEKLEAEVRRINPDIRLWLDLWPPSYSWLLGQDYSRLTQISDTLKHFPYHKLGGGADVQGLIHYFAKNKEQQEEAFQAFLKIFGLKYSLTYEAFQDKGYPIEFVKNENNKVRELSRSGTKIFSGVQMWNISPEDLLHAIAAAEASAADDVLYYCYGWADIELFQAVADRN